ncbi:MAG: hypothetical protein ABEJ70_04800 [Halobacteriaceae archaeon]
MRAAGLAVAVCLLSAAVLAGPTVAGFVVTSHRTADVVTAPDDRAYLGVAVPDRTLANGRHAAVPLATVTNRFPGPLTSVTVRVRDADPRPPRLLSAPTWTGSLAVGERVTVPADVVCGGGGGPHDATETWTVDVAAESPDVAVTVTRRVAVTCEPPAPRGPPDRAGGPPATPGRGRP